MKGFFRLFKIKEDEIPRVTGLFFYQFFTVSAFVLGRIIRDTLFIQRYKPDHLPLMYIAVAIVVSLTVGYYTRKSIYFRMDKLIILTQTISAVLFLVFIFVIKQRSQLSYFSYPVLYVFVELFGAFMMFQFWSFTNEILDSREAKRVLGFIGIGGVLASLSAGTGVREFVKYMNVEDILFFNIFFIIFSIAIVIRMGSSYKLKLQRGVVAKSGSAFFSKNPRERIFKSPYVKYIALMTAFIFIVVTFIDYEFKIVAGQNFDEKELASFFGTVYAISGGLLSLLVQLFMTSYLLKTSIFLSLAILPAAITLFSSLFLVVPPGLEMFSYSLSLIFITMARSSDYAFRYTVNDAAMQLLYIPLDSKIKSRVKAIVDGIFKPVCIGVAGLAIYGISRAGIGLDVISAIVVIVGSTWLIVIFVIRKEYLTVLGESLKKKALAEDDVEIREQFIESMIKQGLSSGKEDEILMSLDLIKRGKKFRLLKHFIPLLNAEIGDKIKLQILRVMRKSEVKKYSYEIMKLLRSPSDALVSEAILTYGHMQIGKMPKYVVKFLDSEDIGIRSSAIISLIKYSGISGVMKAAPYLDSMTRSNVVEHRVAAANILGQIGQKNMQYKIFEMLNDNNANVRREAVKASSLIGAELLIPKLFFMLTDKSVTLDVSRSLVSFGEKILNPAKNILENGMDSSLLKIRVASLLGNINSPGTMDILFDGLDSKSDELRNEILKSLIKLIKNVDHAMLSEKQLKRYLFKELYYYFQVLYFKDVIRKRIQNVELLRMMDRKLEFAFERIFHLLSLIYGSDLFESIYFNLTQKFVSQRQRSNALEIIDNIVAKDEKKILIPLIESDNESEKLRIGYNNFRIKKMRFNAVLEMLLLDDNPWMRSLLIFVISQNKIFEMSDTISTFIFDSSPLVRETAVYAISSMNIKAGDGAFDFLLTDENKNVREYAAHIKKKHNEKEGADAHNS